MNLVRRASTQLVAGGMSISDFDRALDAAYGGAPSYTGKLVSQSTAMAVSTAWACINGLSGDIARLPLLTCNDTDSGPEPAKQHYLWPLLLEEANPEMSAFRFKQLMQTWVLLWGNAYAEMEISGRGQVVALWPWRPDRVKLSRGPDGKLLYSYRMQNAGKPITLSHERILHLRGLGTDGVMGLSPIDVHRQTFGASMAITEHGARFFSNGARPLGAISVPGPLSDKAYERLIANWSSMHQGLDNAHRVAILEEGTQWKDIGANMVDAQYIQAQQLTQEDICRIYNYPPHRAGLMDRATNANVSQMALEYIMYNLSPWTENWRQEATIALLSPRERQTVSLGWDFWDLLQGDFDSTSKLISVLRQWGCADADTIRSKFFKWTALPDGLGKTIWTPVNVNATGENRQTESQQPMRVVQPVQKLNGKALPA